ncbi:hypothetical protein MTER_10370 [Mycolicibacter terrae]|uniref:Uncharacterized protein n=1 Tax=Mycolicibacter terrae TaxID=1788 RepID=A0AAD1MGH8_9MYCO|nr:hypothetical protein MTER_10370 [Mycolicibacter terrae]
MQQAQRDGGLAGATLDGGQVDARRASRFGFGHGALNLIEAAALGLDHREIEAMQVIARKCLHGCNLAECRVAQRSRCRLITTRWIWLVPS